MGIKTTHKMLTHAWTPDVRAVQAGIEQFSRTRAVTNDCEVALFEMAADDQLHVNVTHKYATRTVTGWAGPGRLRDGFVHNRRFDGEAETIIRHIREMVFATRI
jgi:hypothetical protein